MDLTNFANEIGFAEQLDTYRMPVKGPDGLPIMRLDGVQFYVEVASSDMSEDALEVFREDFDLAKAAAKSGTEAAPDRYDDKREENNRFIARLCRGWNFQNLKTGEDVPFSQEAAFQTLNSVKNAWLRSQVNNAVTTRANFFQKPSVKSKK